MFITVLLMPVTGSYSESDETCFSVHNIQSIAVVIGVEILQKGVCVKFSSV
jgi:hypothetical protein